MKRTPTSSCFAAALFAVSLSIADGQMLAQEIAEVVHLDFENGEIEHWVDVKLAKRSTSFTVVWESQESVLRVESDESAAALWHKLDLSPTTNHVVSWRWKVASALSGNAHEREKKGDDYASRFFVIFDDEPFSKRTRAICYVWAASELVGAVYPNPYFANVATIVLQSGNANAGEWIVEERQFVEDYVRAFGRAPQAVTAVAVMADTDNTKRNSTAWFDKISVRLRSAEPADSGPSHSTGP